uniref:C6 domain-containing protein n=1 Tax=Strongyloides papillosus TaxID=174720 RepID=A0A0N5C6W4_STREA
MKFCKVLTLFTIISTFNIVEIFAWNYKITITFRLLCYSYYTGEKYTATFYVNSKTYGYDSKTCGNEGHIEANVQASEDPLNVGKVTFIYQQHKTKNFTLGIHPDKGCKSVSIGANWYDCDFGFIDPNVLKNNLLTWK